MEIVGRSLLLSGVKRKRLVEMSLAHAAAAKNIRSVAGPLNKSRAVRQCEVYQVWKKLQILCGVLRLRVSRRD